MTARLPIEKSETLRLESLHALMIVDSDPEPLFDTIARAAAEMCSVPIALVTLVDAERQWFKANFGAQGYTETPRSMAFCAHTIGSDELLEVPDAKADARFSSNPLVCGEPEIRFYAGAPLILDDGQRVGTLCVMDRRPRKLDAAQAAMLKSLAAVATQALQLRRDLLERAMSARSQYERALARSEANHRAMVEGQTELVSLSNASGELIYVNQAFCSHFGRDATALIGSGLYVGVDAGHLLDVQQQIESVFATGQARQSDFRTVDVHGNVHWVSWVHSLQRDIDGVAMLHSVGRDITERRLLVNELAEKERFVRQITDNLPIQVAYVDTGRRYRFANAVHCRRMGLSREAMLGYTRSELTGGVDDAEFDPRLDAALAGQPQRFELAVDAGGVPALMETHLIPDIGDDGTVRGVFATALNITARIRSERSVRELVSIFDNTPDFVLQTNAAGELTYINPAARRIAGIREREAVEGVNYARFDPSANTRRFQDVIQPHVERTGLWLSESTIQTAGGDTIPVSHMVIGHRDETGRVYRYSTLLRDISEEVTAKHQHQRQAATLRSVTEAIPVMVAVVGADLRYRFVNGAFAKWCGAASETVPGRSVEEVLGDELYKRSRPWMDRVLAGEPVVFEKEPGGRNPDRYLSISYIPLWLDDRTVDGFVTVVQDTTRQKREENRLKHLSQRDSLTGLLNRTGLELYLENVLREPDQPGEEIGLLYIDLDLFKPVNDTFGHAVGDELLKLFGRRLIRLVRPTDAVVRLGGDEFAVVLSGVRDNSGIGIVADKIIAMAQSAFPINGLQVSIGASVGFALGIDKRDGWSGLLKRADAMLYRAKAAGKGRQCGESD